MNNRIRILFSMITFVEFGGSRVQTVDRVFGFISAVGHEASAEVLSYILEVDVPMNRIEYVQKLGQKAIALKLTIRPEEGRILTAAEMFQVGFGLQLMERLD